MAHPEFLHGLGAVVCHDYDVPGAGQRRLGEQPVSFVVVGDQDGFRLEGHSRVLHALLSKIPDVLVQHSSHSYVPVLRPVSSLSAVSKAA
jgi:hypothetical protein